MSRGPNPIANAARNEKRQRGLPPNAACAHCGEREPIVLVRETKHQGLIEEHHVAGRANDKEFTVLLCSNCHRRATAQQLDMGALKTMETDNTLDKIIDASYSMAAFHQGAKEAFLRWAEKLTVFKAKLDNRYPDWEAEIAKEEASEHE